MSWVQIPYCEINLFKMSGGCKIQDKTLERGEKPNILAVGHYHKSEYFMYRNVHCFQTACLQAQTPFMRGKGISAFMGGWIVEVHVDEFGTITILKQEYIPFYEAIKDDYLNWR